MPHLVKSTCGDGVGDPGVVVIEPRKYSFEVALFIPPMSINERLALMSISACRVTDDRTIPGVISHNVPFEQWTEVDGAAEGYLNKFVRLQSDATAIPRGGHCDTVAVILTRFIFDHGVDVSALVGHAYVDARALPDWTEVSTQRWPVGTRHSGWAFQAGTYATKGERIFVANALTVHDRGNVGYLVQATATVGDAALAEDDRTELANAVRSINFVD